MDHELEALRRPFRLGVLAVIVAIAALGGLLAAFGTPADRPAGVAERWLVAVADSTRDGVASDAARRAEDAGASVALAARVALVPAAAAADGERAFEDVQVGRAVEAGDTARVGFRVTPYEEEPVEGYVHLIDDGDEGWSVFGVQLADDRSVVIERVTVGLDVDPGPSKVVLDRPERAPAGFFVGAVLLGVLITVGCVVALRAATPKPD